MRKFPINNIYTKKTPFLTGKLKLKKFISSGEKEGVKYEFHPFEHEDSNCILHLDLGHWCHISPSPNSPGSQRNKEIISLFTAVLNLSERGHTQGWIKYTISHPLQNPAPAPQNLRIYLSLRIFSNKKILKFDWLRTQTWAKKVCSAKKKFCGIGASTLECFGM